MRLLLHACCGPCALVPTRLLVDEGCSFALDYTNPNIHPREEYDHRLATLREYVGEPQRLEVIVGSYDPDEWERVAGVHGTDRENRCRSCYRLRFEEVARHAKEHGFDAIGTTLTISPYQFTQVIFEELERAAQQAGVKALPVDYSAYYREGTQLSRELGMYRQNYCGCHFSVAEAAASRAAAREARKRRKAEKRREREAAAQEAHTP